MLGGGARGGSEAPVRAPLMGEEQLHTPGSDADLAWLQAPE